MNCSLAKGLMSSYMDGAVTRSQMASVTQHVHGCTSCAAHFSSLQKMQQLVGSLGRKQAPPEMALKLRVALSQEMASSRRSRWEGLRVRWENAFNAVMVPATAGLITTLIIFGVLISWLYPSQVRASNDVPTMLYTPAQLRSTPFELTMGVPNSDSLIVEAYVGPDGRVQDYRVLSGTENDPQIIPQLKNMLIFTTFQPATAFGRPTSSRVILTFSGIQVKG